MLKKLDSEQKYKGLRPRKMKKKKENKRMR